MWENRKYIFHSIYAYTIKNYLKGGLLVKAYVGFTSHEKQKA